MRILTLAIMAVFLAAPPVSAKCLMSYCKDRSTTPSRTHITNTNRQIVGDLYNPGHNRRIQIRDKDRRILGFFEKDGTITNTRRQRVGTLEVVR